MSSSDIRLDVDVVVVVDSSLAMFLSETVEWINYMNMKQILLTYFGVC